MDRFTRCQTDRYIRDQNVKHYRHLLGHVTEETNRQTILNLFSSTKSNKSNRKLAIRLRLNRRSIAQRTVLWSMSGRLMVSVTADQIMRPTLPRPTNKPRRAFVMPPGALPDHL